MALNFWQKFQLLELILGDISGYAAGKPISTPNPVPIGNELFNASSVILPNGPTAEFPAIGGDVGSLVGLVFTDIAALVAGAPVKFAWKIGNVWNGITFSLVPKT